MVEKWNAHTRSIREIDVAARIGLSLSLSPCFLFSRRKLRPLLSTLFVRFRSTESELARIDWRDSTITIGDVRRCISQIRQCGIETRVFRTICVRVQCRRIAQRDRTCELFTRFIYQLSTISLQAANDVQMKRDERAVCRIRAGRERA